MKRSLLWILVGALALFASNLSLASNLNLEINSLRRSVGDRRLEAAIDEAALGLQSKDQGIRDDAVAFFYDIRANRVLIELLESDEHQDLVAAKYLGLMQFDCLERLFIITHRSLPKKGMTDELSAEKQAARNARIKAINAQAAKVLGVEPVLPSEWNRDAFKEAWLKMLLTAKEKRTLWKPIEETLERIKADMKKDAAKKKDEKYLPEEKKK